MLIALNELMQQRLWYRYRYDYIESILVSGRKAGTDAYCYR